MNLRQPIILKALIAICSLLVIAISGTIVVTSSQSSVALPPAFALFPSQDAYYTHVGENVLIDGVELRVVSVSRGDNFWKIARKYGVNIDTLISANPFWESLTARTNQKVIVPSEKGVLLFIKEYSRIPRIAESYGVSEKDVLVQNGSAIRRFLNLHSDDSKPIAVFVKNARPEPAMMTEDLAKKFAVREMFRSPLGGRFSSHFGMRVHPILNRNKFHDGLDIATGHGTPVGAAAGGVVSATGWMGGYGKAVIIEHKNGFRTLYGHLSQISVGAGQKVKAGQFIGRVGSTGMSTGPHLHFTIWQYGRLIDPLAVLW